MNDTDRFTLMIDALTELAEEEKQAHPTPPAPDLPNLSNVLADVSPLPQEAIFLGMADDGLPVLLNLFDPIPGPILIAADRASGKTSLLKMIARAVDLLHPPSAVQYSVITGHPNEWDKFQDSQNNVGIYTAEHNGAHELLNSLVTWARGNQNETQSIALLIDDLETATKLDGTAAQDLRRLLLRGPNRRVWPIITVNAGRAQSIEAWISLFRTRLFGRISDVTESQFLSGQPGKSLADLIPGCQFTMPEGNNWLNFWAPGID